MKAKNNFGQTVKGLTKGKGGIGKQVSALAKAKAKPVKLGKPVKIGKPTEKPLNIDDDIIRTMPITQKQLGQIKGRYGIK